MAKVFGYSSLSSLTAFGLAPVYACLITGGNYQIALVALIVGGSIWVRHHENLRRLLNGTEGKINLGGKKPGHG
jgi:glycerol-3-phosphate acyltransferase PlsY